MKGRVVGDWTFGELLGQGGQGAVYRGEHRLLKTSFAIKVVHTNTESSDRWSFSREAEIAASLAHPNITRAYLPFEIDGEDILCLPMELLTGEPLSDRIRREKREPWDVGEALSVATQTCEALAFAHKAGIVHRDIKPSNLFLTLTSDIKVLDFGLARSAEATQTDHKGVKGTLPFFAPELLRGEAPSAASDVYGLGAVLYRLLTGQLPVQINPAAPVDQQLRAIVEAHRDGIPLAHHKVAAIPEEVSTLVATLLAGDPEARPLNGQEALVVLRRYSPTSEDPTQGVHIPDSDVRESSVIEDPGPTLVAPGAATPTDVDPSEVLRPTGGASTLPSFTFGQNIEAQAKLPGVDEPNAADTLEAKPEDGEDGEDGEVAEVTDDDAGVEHTMPVDLTETLARIAQMEADQGPVIANEARESEAILELPDQTIKRAPFDPASQENLHSAISYGPSSTGVDVRQFKSKAPLYTAVIAFGLMVGGVGWALLPSGEPPQPIEVRSPTPRASAGTPKAEPESAPVPNAPPVAVPVEPPARVERRKAPTPAPSSKRSRRSRRRREARKIANNAQRLMLSGGLDPAFSSLMKCLQVDPSYAVCHRLLGVYYARTNQPDNSLNSYRRYLKLAPKARDAAMIRDIVKKASGGGR